MVSMMKDRPKSMGKEALMCLRSSHEKMMGFQVYPSNQTYSNGILKPPKGPNWVASQQTLSFTSSARPNELWWQSNIGWEMKIESFNCTGSMVEVHYRFKALAIHFKYSTIIQMSDHYRSRG